MSRIVYILSFSLLFLHSSCKKEHSESSAQYLFLGHTYDWLAENRIDPRLELLDFSTYDGIWLGGDICARSSKDTSTLAYLDNIFNLSKPTTHWAIGNHDLLDGDQNKIERFTHRPSFYSYHQNGFYILVLNTNLFWHNTWDPSQENCEEKEAQMAFIKHFCDTLTAASQLIVLHHHGIFNEKKVNQQGVLISPDNIDAIPIRTDCRPTSDLTADWYPYLLKVRSRGILVYCIAGDGGMNSKKYHFETSEGIHLLGTGINNSLDMRTPAPYVKNFNPDSVLIVEHWQEKDSLSWGFIRLNDLILKQNPTLLNNSMTERLRILMEKY